MLDIGQRSHQRASLVTTTDHAINKPDVVCMTKRSASLQDPCGVGWTKVTLLSDVILLMSNESYLLAFFTYISHRPKVNGYGVFL